MHRGETATVAFAIAGGSDVRVATDMIGGQKGQMQSFRPKIGRFMAARLSGEGFEIVPLDQEEQDLFLSRAGLWQWRVKAVKGDRHALKLSAWVKVQLPDKSRKPLWFKTVNRDVEVPLRFFPDQMEDFFDATLAWFVRLETWVKALAALIAALSGLWLAIRYFGKDKKKPPA